MEQLFLLWLIIGCLFFIVSANHSNKLPHITSVRTFLVANGILKDDDYDIIVKKCASSSPCRHGRCFMVEKQRFCLCPEGYSFESGQCINDRKNCQRNSNCYPGQCSVQKGWNTCLCPEGYYSERGICKEFQWNCKMIDCRPGKCLNEFSMEKCLCPEGYTSKTGRCIEIAYTSTGQISTIMLMIIVAIASVMLTTFFGVCICYYTHQSTQ